MKKNEKEIMPLLCFGLIKDVLQKYAFGNDKIQNKWSVLCFKCNTIKIKMEILRTSSASA